MNKVRVFAKRFITDERGLETVEYAIITGLIVAATIGAIAAIGAWVLAQFQTLQGGLVRNANRVALERRMESEDMAIMGLWNPEVLPIQWGVVLVASLVAATTDLRDRRIPNALTFPLFLAGLVASFTVGGWLGLVGALIAAVILSLPYVYLFIAANGGAGDAKLMAALGAWLGVATGLVVLVAVALAGAAFALVWIWMHRDTQKDELRAMPYGVAISLGVCVAAVGMWCWRLA